MMSLYRPLATIIILCVFVGCASDAGKALSTTTENGHRIEGIELGSAGSWLSLSSGGCYLPAMTMFRRMSETSEWEYGLRAHIVTPGMPLEFNHMVATTDAGERTLPGRVIASHNRSIAFTAAIRCEEIFEIPMTKDDIRWLAESRTLQLYLDGRAAFAKPEIHQKQTLGAICKFRDTYLGN